MSWKCSLRRMANGLPPSPDSKLLSGEDPHKLYQIKPELFVLFDEINFPDNPRQEWRP